MTSIERFFTDTATIKRLLVTGDKSGPSAAGTIKVHIQQVGAEEALQVGGVFGKTWKLWTPLGADIKETDTVEITVNGVARDMRVKGIKELFVNQSLNKHLEIIIFDDLS